MTNPIIVIPFPFIVVRIFTETFYFMSMIIKYSVNDYDNFNEKKKKTIPKGNDFYALFSTIWWLVTTLLRSICSSHAMLHIEVVMMMIFS